MKPLVLVFWNICLLRRGPEQVPTAAWFVASVALADLLMSLLLSLRMDPAFEVLPALTYLLVNMSVIASVTWFALKLKDFEGRFLWVDISTRWVQGFTRPVPSSRQEHGSSGQGLESSGV